MSHGSASTTRRLETWPFDRADVPSSLPRLASLARDGGTCRSNQVWLTGIVMRPLGSVGIALIQVGAWLALSAIALRGSELVFGVDVSERLAAFSNAHLLEEAFEGPYEPLDDPLFVGFSLAVALLAFGLPALLASKLWREGTIPVGASVVLAAIALLGLRYWVFEVDYPWPLRRAHLAQVGLSLLAGISAVALGRSSRGMRHAG